MEIKLNNRTRYYGKGDAEFVRFQQQSGQVYLNKFAAETFDTRNNFPERCDVYWDPKEHTIRIHADETGLYCVSRKSHGRSGIYVTVKQILDIEAIITKKRYGVEWSGGDIVIRYEVHG